MILLSLSTMKSTRYLVSAALTLAAVAIVAQTPPPPDAPARSAADQGSHHAQHEVHFRRLDRDDEEGEKPTFLGVETSPVSKALVAQLNLPTHTGLVVLHIVPNTAAAGALKPYDILLKLDDQILVDEHQLAVLVRGHHEGDEVTLSYVRGGQPGTAKVKLGKREAGKVSLLMHQHHAMLHGSELGDAAIAGHAEHDHVEHMLSMIEHAHHGEPVRIEIERGEGAGMHAVKIDTANSNLVYSDEQGSLDLTVKDGHKTLVAKNAKGEQQFTGPATTEAERRAIPADVRSRLEKLESMHNIAFRPDADFEGAETRVMAEGASFRSQAAHREFSTEAY